VMGQEPPIAQDQPRDLNLSGASRKRLVAALLDAFDRAGFEQLARFHLNEDFEEIAGGGNLRQMAFSLVEWAASHGRLPDLVAGALAENPGNPALQAFNEEIWTRALAGDPTVLAQPGELTDVSTDDARRRSFGTPVIAGLLIAIVVIAGVAWYVLGNRGGSPPAVSLANAALSARAVDDEGHDVFDIGFQITLDNYESSSVVVEAIALNADSLQPVSVDAPPAQRFIPDLPHEEVRSTFRFRYTVGPQCIFVRISAFDGNGYPRNRVELTQTRTPSFDAWNPANPSCPQAAT
ncbi:MAG: effector-associated domain EAD1-containing protein, partial [Thermomicrobiales bacterium]